VSHRARVILAFASVSLIWGSTFLAIRYAVETLPPFFMVAVRGLVAGSFLLAWGQSRGEASPTRAEWGKACLVGALLFCGGQGGLAWAEQRVPSSLAALVFATMPLWVVLITGPRGQPRALIGLLLGFGGTVLLLSSQGAGSRVDLIGGGVLMLATLSWTSGSLLARRIRGVGFRTNLGMQLVGGGSVLVAVAFGRGELAQLGQAVISLRSVVALAYLTIFGSLIAFACYSWLLRNEEPHRVATYAYICPMVALLLGALTGEPVTARLLIGGAIVIVSLVIVLGGRPAIRREPRPLRAR